MIKQLKEKNVIPIARAQMRIRITLQGGKNEKLIERLKELVASVEEENVGARYEAVYLIDPGNYRGIDELLDNETKGKGVLEVLNLKETVEGDQKMK